jgi:quinolinate synthase
LWNEDVDVAITSEGSGEQIAAGVSFVSLPERAAITLHEELVITPTWRAKCQMVRSGQPTGVLMPVVYLFGGEIGG